MLASGKLESDGGFAPRAAAQHRQSGPALYTPEQRLRRDQSRWTLVQGILAPIQFFIFLGSLALVIRFLWTGQGEAIAEASILLKTGILYLIMVTGSIWEKVVFDEWLFAEPFFWEDVVSMGVMALHTAYVLMLIYGLGSPTDRMLVALAAYASYVINAAQFLYKLRLARLSSEAAKGAA